MRKEEKRWRPLGLNVLFLYLAFRSSFPLAVSFGRRLPSPSRALSSIKGHTASLLVQKKSYLSSPFPGRAAREPRLFRLTMTFTPTVAFCSTYVPSRATQEKIGFTNTTIKRGIATSSPPYLPKKSPNFSPWIIPIRPDSSWTEKTDVRTTHSSVKTRKSSTAAWNALITPADGATLRFFRKAKAIPVSFTKRISAVSSASSMEKRYRCKMVEGSSQRVRTMFCFSSLVMMTGLPNMTKPQAGQPFLRANTPPFHGYTRIVTSLLRGITLKRHIFGNTTTEQAQ